MASRVKSKCHFRLTESAFKLRHVSPQEIIKARMIELWGKPNNSRLAREAEMDRASVAKIMNYNRGIGPEVAAKLAKPLGLDPSQLVPPSSERVTVETLLHRLDEERDQAERGRRALARSLKAIHDDLRRIEARLPAEAQPAQEGQS